jgi:DNA-binding NarL/FixJ family response regulator
MKLHMLLLEDEDALRHNISQMLRRQFPECVVDAAKSYEEAQKVVRTSLRKGHLTRVVIVDEQLKSNKRGSDFLVYLRRYHPGVKTIMLSAVATLQNVSKAINQGGLDRYILKSQFAQDSRLLFDAVRDLLQEDEGPILDGMLDVLNASIEADGNGGALLYAGTDIVTPKDLLKDLRIGTKRGRQHIKEFSKLMYEIFQNPEGALRTLARVEGAKQKASSRGKAMRAKKRPAKTQPQAKPKKKASRCRENTR